MESSLYKSAFEKGEAKGKTEGKAEGEAKTKADLLIQILMRKLVTLDTTVRERIRATSDREMLSVWLNQALDLTDTEQARQLVEKIQQALVA